MSYTEDETIKLPVVENGVVAIGDLFDCVTSKSSGYNLFGQKLTNEHLIAHPQRDFEYTLNYIKDTETKVNEMHIDASVSLELLAGKLTLSGSFLYDSKDNENFNDDTFDCNMRLDSFIVQALPAAKNAIDPDVKALLEGPKRKITATHVCTQVYIGAEACATLKVNEKGMLNHFNIAGKLSGSITLGPMSGSASVGLEFLDSYSKEDVTKKITVKSKPPTINQPTNITEMFEAVNAIPAQIAKEQHFKMITDQNVTGVPLRFVLSPIKQFLPDLAVKRTYRVMNVELQRRFLQMMFILVDYQTEGHFKTLVLHGDRRLLTILQDVDNPLTVNVMAEEKRLQGIATDLHRTSSELLEKYKLEEATEEDLEKQIERYNENFKIQEVILKVEEFIREGKALLAGVHLTDLDEDTTNIKLFTNVKELGEWLSQERKIKVLLNTNSLAGSPPGGAFLTLYKLSPFLKTFDVDVAVAFPNISENFSLIIKANHLEKEYLDEEIEFALELMAVAIGQGKQIHTTFYTVLASLSGIRLPLKNNLEDLNPLISTLRATQDIKICTSYLTTREAIADNDPSESKWKFVLELDASESVADTVHFFRRFYNNIPADLKRRSEFIAGTFGMTGFHDAPILFVFKNNELRAICLDNLDLLILEEQLEESVMAPDLDVISSEKVTWRGLYPSKVDFSLNVLELLGQHHKALSKDTGILESLGLADPPRDNLSKSMLVTKAALSGKPVDVISALGIVCLQDFDDLLPVLKKNKWSEVSKCFPATMKFLHWQPVAEEALEFFQKRNPFLAIAEYTAKKIKELLEEAETENSGEQASENPRRSRFNRFNKAGGKSGRRKKSGRKSVAFLKTGAKTEDEEGEEPPPEKTIEEIIDEHIKVVVCHDDCPEELRALIRDYHCVKGLDLKVNGVAYVLEAYLHKCFSEGNTSHLRAFINLAEQMALEENAIPDSTIMDIIGMLVRNAISDEAMAYYSGAGKSLDDYLKRQNLYETLSVLSKCKWNPHLYLVHHTIFFLPTLYDIDVITQLVIDMASTENGEEFTNEDYNDLWQNPKFAYLFRKGLYIDRVIDSIKVYQCEVAKENEIAIPDFLPQDFQDRVRQLIAQESKFIFPWETNWTSEEIILTLFQSISVRGYLPLDFNLVLQKNITDNVEAKEFLKTVGVLYFWDEKESLFTQPWDVFTVQRATEKVQSFLSKRNIEETVQVEIVIDQESIDKLESQPVTNLEFIESWRPITNDLIFPTSVQKYRQMTTIIDQFSKEDDRQLHTTVSRSIPYLLEKLKMFNTAVLDPEEVLEYLPYTKKEDYNLAGRIDFRSEAEIINVPFVSSTDLINCLLSCSDSNVAGNILSRFFKSRFALPLLIPEITTRKIPGIDLFLYNSRLLLPFLKNLPIQWKPSPELYPNSPPQKHYLFRDPSRMIISFRIGTYLPGKSFLLNSVLNRADSQDVFFSRVRRKLPEFGQPLSLDGLVEFIWLTEETCSPDLWKKAQEHHYNKGTNEALLLANIHGEIFEHLDILKELYKFASCFLVFVLPHTNINTNQNSLNNGHENLKDQVEMLSQIVNKSDMYYMLVKGGTPDNPFNEAEAKKDLINIFGTVFDHNAKPWSLDELKISSPVYMPDDVHLPETKRLINRIKIDSGPKIRETMQLQKLPQYKIKEFNDTWTENEPLQTLISLFASILTLAPRLRNAALYHLQQEVRIMSFSSTEKLRKQIAELTEELYDSTISGKRDIIVNVQNQLKEAKANLANWSLDLEHFFREIGRVYEATDGDMHLNYKILNSYAEHIAQGNEIEIFSQEYGTGDIIWGRWLKETFSRSRLFNKTRVFVLSVLGMTSSGKSTLLNTLFGSNFFVHDGGCTRGLHMRLVTLDEKLVEETKYDAILVIDSEGLGSRGNITDGKVEMIADTETEVKMRKLASFVLGISNLTLLNVRGDALNEMKSILEIAFLKQLMATNGEKSEDDITLPDLLIIQHDSNSENPVVVDEVKEAMKNACTLADKSELHTGVRTRSGRKLEKIMQRMKVDDIHRKFKPYFSENSNRGPSIEYHQSAVDLYKEILTICKSSTDIATPRKFLDWYEESEHFWIDNICSNSFPLEFYNTNEVSDFMEDRVILAEVKETIELAFKSHQEEIEGEMAHLFQFENNENSKELRKIRGDTLQWLHHRLQQITATCKIFEKDSNRDQEERVEVPCRPCQKALKLKEGIYSRKTVTVVEMEMIDRYVIDIRENIWNHWNQSLFAREMVANKSAEFEDILNSLTLDECWNPRIKCNMTALKRAISLKTTVIAPGRQIEIDTLGAYHNLPHLLCELENDDLPQLGKIQAFDLDYYSALKNADEVDCKRKSQYLDQSQQDWIQEKIKDLPALLLKVRQAQLYEIGLVRELQERVEIEILGTFENLEKEVLLPDFKWQCHLYAIKILKQEMEKLQEKWDKDNQPLRVLPSVLENYTPKEEN